MNFFEYTYNLCSQSDPDAHIKQKKIFLNEIAPNLVFGHIKEKVIDESYGVFKALVDDPIKPNSSEVELSFDKYLEAQTEDQIESSLHKTFNSSKDETISIFIKKATQELAKAMEEVENHENYFSKFPKYKLSLKKIYELLNQKKDPQGGRHPDFDPHDTYLWYHELIQKDEFIKNGKPYLKLIDQEIARLHQNKHKTNSPPDRSTIRRHRRKYNLTRK
ncbi:MAG: hypothetical protein WD511_00655 [Balneolaceae bacterium]